MQRILFLTSLLMLAIIPLQADDLQYGVTVAFDYSGDIYVADFSGDPVSITSSETYEMIPRVVSGWCADCFSLQCISIHSG